MKFSTAALGLCGAATAAVASTVLLNNYLGQDVEENSPPSPPEGPESAEGFDEEDGGVSGTGQGGVAFKALFDVNKINRSATSRPILLFDKGSCFSSFFPEAELSAPTQTTTLNKSVGSAGVIPAGFSLASKGGTQPVGCKMMKFSGAKDDAAFGYMTETTVRSGEYGLAMYAAVTNTRQKTMTDLEYWLLFMKKDVNKNKWIVNKSYYLALGLGTTVTTSDNKSTQKQNNFYAKAPDDTEMRWSSPTTASEIFNKFFDTSADTSSLWDDTKDKYYVGLWVGGGDGNNDELFYDGSNEKWALKEWFGSSEEAKKNEPSRFLNSVNLTQKGKWQSIGDACADLKGKAVSSMTTGAISKCIRKKVLTSSTVA